MSTICTPGRILQTMVRLLDYIYKQTSQKRKGWNIQIIHTDRWTKLFPIFWDTIAVVLQRSSNGQI